MSDFAASLLMILVFAGTWFTLFFVGGASWLAEASVLRARYQTPDQAPASDLAVHSKAQASTGTATKRKASPTAHSARVTRLVAG